MMRSDETDRPLESARSTNNAMQVKREMDGWVPGSSPQVRVNSPSDHLYVIPAMYAPFTRPCSTADDRCCVKVDSPSPAAGIFRRTRTSPGVEVSHFSASPCKTRLTTSRALHRPCDGQNTDGKVMVLTTSAHRQRATATPPEGRGAASDNPAFGSSFTCIPISTISVVSSEDPALSRLSHWTSSLKRDLMASLAIRINWLRYA